MLSPFFTVYSQVLPVAYSPHISSRVTLAAAAPAAAVAAAAAGRLGTRQQEAPLARATALVRARPGVSAFWACRCGHLGRGMQGNAPKDGSTQPAAPARHGQGTDRQPARESQAVTLTGEGAGRQGQGDQQLGLHSGRDTSGDRRARDQLILAKWELGGETATNEV